MKIEEELLDRIANIKWCHNCGQPNPLKDTSLQHTRVHTWEAARKFYQSPTWENTTLEARNQLTAYLQARYKNKLADWNKLAREAKSFFQSQVEPALMELMAIHNLDQTFIDMIAWDIVSAIMEHAYKVCPKRPVFFLEMLAIYEAGHLPCGWNGDWPDGELVVF